MSLIRYRPIIKNKEADMAADVSGAWTSLTCYYTLHDKIVSLQAENERIIKHADAMARALEGNGFGGAVKLWNEAKGVQS
jgi:hypothetical protein